MITLHSVQLSFWILFISTLAVFTWAFGEVCTRLWKTQWKVGGECYLKIYRIYGILTLLKKWFLPCTLSHCRRIHLSVLNETTNIILLMHRLVYTHTKKLLSYFIHSKAEFLLFKQKTYSFKMDWHFNLVCWVEATWRSLIIFHRPPFLTTVGPTCINKFHLPVTSSKDLNVKGRYKKYSLQSC